MRSFAVIRLREGRRERTMDGRNDMRQKKKARLRSKRTKRKTREGIKKPTAGL